MSADRMGGAADRGRLSRWFRRFRPPWPKRVVIGAAGYAVVAIFGVGTAIAWAVGASLRGALVVGVLAAAPVVVALVGERVTRVKAFGVEISLVSLAEVTVDIDVEPDFSKAAMSSVSVSATQPLVDSFKSLMQKRSKLLRINLRDDKYWWSTRIFLVTALAQDYTEVESLIFVRSDDEQIFVGIASAGAVHARLAEIFPEYELAYRNVRAAAVAPPPGLPTDPGREVNEILMGRQGIGGWQDALWLVTAKGEDELKEIVGSDEIRKCLREYLDTKALPYGPLTTSLRNRIISRDQHYAALTDHLRQLKAVVDRNELAVRSAAAALERRRGS